MDSSGISRSPDNSITRQIPAPTLQAQNQVSVVRFSYRPTNRIQCDCLGNKHLQEYSKMLPMQGNNHCKHFKLHYFSFPQLISLGSTGLPQLTKLWSFKWWWMNISSIPMSVNPLMSEIESQLNKQRVFHYMPLILSVGHKYSTHSFVKLILCHFRVCSSCDMC